MLGSLHDAEDAVQETLLRAWRYRGGAKQGVSLRPWLLPRCDQRLSRRDRS